MAWVAGSVGVRRGDEQRAGKEEQEFSEIENKEREREKRIRILREEEMGGEDVHRPIRDWVGYIRHLTFENFLRMLIAPNCGGQHRSTCRVFCSLLTALKTICTLSHNHSLNRRRQEQSLVRHEATKRVAKRWRRRRAVKVPGCLRYRLRHLHKEIEAASSRT